jgi:hypothetical protein
MQPRKLRPTILVLANAFLAAGLLWSHYGSKKPDDDNLQGRQLGALSYLLHVYHFPDAPQAHKLEGFLNAHPDYLDDNPENRGAEVMFQVFGHSLPDPESGTDWDNDGRKEVHDIWGNPLLFFHARIQRDTIVFEGGERQSYAVPPYVDTSRPDRFYINSVLFHSWTEADAESLRNEIEMRGEGRDGWRART